MPSSDGVSFPVARNVLAAGGGAAITDSIFNPLEVVKVRMQLSAASTSAAASASASLQPSAFRRTLSHILTEDGLWLLWTPGLVATWLRAITYTGFRVVNNVVDSCDLYVLTPVLFPRARSSQRQPSQPDKR